MAASKRTPQSTKLALRHFAEESSRELRFPRACSTKFAWKARVLSWSIHWTLASYPKQMSHVMNEWWSVPSATPFSWALCESYRVLLHCRKIALTVRAVQAVGYRLCTCQRDEESYQLRAYDDGTFLGRVSAEKTSKHGLCYTPAIGGSGPPH